jgi:hypothetical protein
MQRACYHGLPLTSCLWSGPPNNPFKHLSFDIYLQLLQLLPIYIISGVGRDSSLGVATRKGLDGPGSIPPGAWMFVLRVLHGRRKKTKARTIKTKKQSRWGRALEPTQPPTQQVPRIFPGSQAARRGANYPPPPSAVVKDRATPHLPHPPARTFMASSRANFTFNLHLTSGYRMNATMN